MDLAVGLNAFWRLQFLAYVCLADCQNLNRLRWLPVNLLKIEAMTLCQVLLKKPFEKMLGFSLWLAKHLMQVRYFRGD